MKFLAMLSLAALPLAAFGEDVAGLYAAETNFLSQAEMCEWLGFTPVKGCDASGFRPAAARLFWEHGATLVTSPERAYRDWTSAETASIAAYKGFFWNNEPTNVTVTFATSLADIALVWIDGELLMSNVGSMSNSKGRYTKTYFVKCATAELSPGPHRFLFVAGHYTTSTKGPRNISQPDTLGAEWKARFGIAWRYGTNEANPEVDLGENVNSADYTALSNAAGKPLLTATSGDCAAALPPLPEGAFTYAVIPDTQLYHGIGAHVKEGDEPQTGPTTNPAFESRVRWIEANIEKENIVFVSHVGDIVDYKNDEQWTFASNLMARLDGKIPYGISPGNHDIATYSTDDFNRYFPRARYEGNAWYAGAFGGYTRSDGKFASGGNANSCQLFEADGMKFVALHLECNAPAPVLEWVDSMLRTHADRKAIICTHMYIGYKTEEIDELRRHTSSRPDEWFGVMDWTKCHKTDGVSAVDAWETCFSKHGNLILIVSGDQSPAICWREKQKGVNGNTVHSTLQDYPRTADDQDWIRLYRFRPELNRIDVWTYSPQLDEVCQGVGFRKGRDWHVFTLNLADRRFNVRIR